MVVLLAKHKLKFSLPFTHTHSADDMGLGKTLSMIALIVKTRGKTAEAVRGGGGGPTLQSKGTLVIAPLTLTRMWEEEIVKMVYPGTLSVFLYHGPKRPEDPRE